MICEVGRAAARCVRGYRHADTFNPGGCCCCTCTSCCGCKHCRSCRDSKSSGRGGHSRCQAPWDPRRAARLRRPAAPHQAARQRPRAHIHRRPRRLRTTNDPSISKSRDRNACSGQRVRFRGVGGPCVSAGPEASQWKVGRACRWHARRMAGRDTCTRLSKGQRRGGHVSPAPPAPAREGPQSDAPDRSPLPGCPLLLTVVPAAQRPQPRAARRHPTSAPGPPCRARRRLGRADRRRRCPPAGPRIAPRAMRPRPQGPSPGVAAPA
jgi:hypothetical protein